MRSLLLLAVAACAKVEGPAAFEDPTIEVIEGQDFETTVRGLGNVPGIPEFEMHFPRGVDVVHLPDRLLINGQQMLATTPNCINESQVGIAMFPMVTAAASSAMDGGTPTKGDDNGTPNFVGIDVRGPHLARIVVGYSVDYTCNGEQKLTGETTFLIYGTGRIVRADRRVRGSSGVLADTSGCGCQGASGNTSKVFSTYWSFAPAGQNVDNQDASLGSLASSVDGGACTLFANTALGVRFSEPTSRVRSNAVVAAHVFDFFNNTTDLNLGEQQNFSAVQIEPQAGPGTRCQGMLDRLADGPIEIGNSPYPNTDADGIYQDEVGIRTEPFVIRPPAGSSLPAGFIVGFDLERGNAIITRSSAPTVEPLAYIQRNAPGSKRFLVMFNEGLADGESVTVEPQ